jgi:hypothetical protein
MNQNIIIIQVQEIIFILSKIFIFITRKYIIHFVSLSINFSIISSSQLKNNININK